MEASQEGQEQQAQPTPGTEAPPESGVATGHPVPPPQDATRGPVSAAPPGEAPQSQQEGVQELDEEGAPVPRSPFAELSEEERNPAYDQAPVASDALATSRDPNAVGEQVPAQAEGNPSHVDRPVGTSMPPPQAQSGMPLPEERQAAQEEAASAQEQRAEREGTTDEALAAERKG